MESLRENLREAFNFSISQKRGILFLTFLMMLITGFRYLRSTYFKRTELTEEIKVSYLKFKSKQKEKKQVSPVNKNFEVFAFDPNKISLEEAKKLPIPGFLAERMINYRENVGPYNNAEDLRKLYGMSEENYLKLKDHVRIESKPVEPSKEYSRKKEKILVNLNTVDSVQLTKLRGIGPVYASRIIKYRNSIGGFVKKNQIKEVYGISDSLYSTLEGNLVMDSIPSVNRININSCSLSELKKHPYFRNYNLSRSLVNYRKTHGNFESLTDLKNLHLINDSVYERIEAYIKLK